MNGLCTALGLAYMNGSGEATKKPHSDPTGKLNALEQSSNKNLLRDETSTKENAH